MGLPYSVYYNDAILTEKETCMRHKILTSMAISRQAIELIEKMALKLGLSKTAIMEMAIRKLAEREDVK